MLKSYKKNQMRKFRLSKIKRRYDDQRGRQFQESRSIDQSIERVDMVTSTVDDGAHIVPVVEISWSW